MNSILLTSNINKYAGKNFVPKSFKYQSQPTVKQMNKVISDKFTTNLTYKTTNADTVQLKQMLKAPRIAFNNFSKSLFINK